MISGVPSPGPKIPFPALGGDRFDDWLHLLRRNNLRSCLWIQSGPASGIFVSVSAARNSRVREYPLNFGTCISTL